MKKLALRLRATRELINLLLTKLEDSGDILEDKDSDEFLKQYDTILKNCTEALDEKTKVTENTQLVLLTCVVSQVGITHATRKFFEIRTKLLGRSGKSTHKKNKLPNLYTDLTL